MTPDDPLARAVAEAERLREATDIVNQQALRIAELEAENGVLRDLVPFPPEWRPS